MGTYPRKYAKHLLIRTYDALDSTIAAETEFGTVSDGPAGFYANVVTSEFDYTNRKILTLGTVFSVRALGNYYYVNKVVDLEQLRNAFFWGSSRITYSAPSQSNIIGVGALTGFQSGNVPLSFPGYYFDETSDNFSGHIYGSLGETRPERMYFTVIEDYVKVGEGQTIDYNNTFLTIVQAGSIAQLMETLQLNAPPQTYAISTNLEPTAFGKTWIGSYIELVDLGDIKGLLPTPSTHIKPDKLDNTGIHIGAEFVYTSGAVLDCTDTSTFEIIDAPWAILGADNELIINSLVEVFSFNIKVTNPAVDDPAIITVNLSEWSNNDPYGPGGTSGPGGGGGGFGGGSSGGGDGGPGVPGGSAEADTSSVGLYTRYVMSPSELGQFGGWLWDINYGLIVVKEVVGLIYGEPASSVISIMSYPFNVTSLAGPSATDGKLYWGSFNTKLSARKLSSSAGQFDWGTIDIPEYWGNFLDYSPHTKIELYLPWCSGFISIDANECVGGTLRVVTNVELNKGTCVHTVFGKGAPIASVSGVCGAQIPVTALDSSGKALNLVTAAVSAGSAVASGLAGSNAASNSSIAFRKASFNAFPSGNPIAMSQYTAHRQAAMQAAQAPYQNRARAAGKLAAASAVAAARVPGSVQRSGSFSSAGAGLGAQTPYVIITRPIQSIPNNYGAYYGYPSNIYGRMGTLKGYTEIGEVHLDNLAITESEKNELDAILKGGVIF